MAIVGASGAGKSTLAKILVRFYDPDGGRLLLDGHDLRDITLESLRRNVAVLLQETLLFDGTVRDNIGYGRHGATEVDIIRAAVAADAHDFITALPEGYDTRIGEEVGGCRVAKGNDLRSPAPCCATRRYCCSTSRRLD